jgi:putative FmdB family regulatory protein
VPAYDYICEECGERFEVRMSMAAYSEAKQPPCEHCGSTRVARSLNAVGVLTGGRGGSATGGAACCGANRGFT